jgi:CRP-like cAMP-binding protein
VELAKVTLFHFMSSQQLADLESCMTILEKKTGDRLIMQGEDVQGLYVVAQGKTGVYIGRSVRPMAVFEKGEVFGEMAFLDRAKASASIKAETTPTEILFWSRQDLDKRLKENYSFATNFYKGTAINIANRLRNTTQYINKELDVAKQFFRDLSAIDASAKTLPEVNSAIRTRFDKLVGDVDSIETRLRSLADQFKERAGSLSEVFLELDQHKETVRRAGDKIYKQVVHMTDFIEKIEHFFLLNSDEFHR